MNQAQFISMYNKNNVPEFNEKLFERDDNAIIDELKNAILSSQRKQMFEIEVLNFEVIEDYKAILDYMSAYDAKVQEKRKKQKPNVYNYVNVKGSAVKLLIVTYRIAVPHKEEEEIIVVPILVPRIVNKYYFKIGGNFYSAMYQIVDGSTYNNSLDADSSPMVTQKSINMPIRIFRNSIQQHTTTGEEIISTQYNSKIFNTSFGVFKYLLAKFGLYGAMNKAGINNVYITENDLSIMDDSIYTFKINGRDMYVSTPKFLYDKNTTHQSFVNDVIKTLRIDDMLSRIPSYEFVFTNEYWISSLGAEFGSFTVDKGDSIIKSLESIYDISTKESIKLPEEDKEDIYAILLWLVREFHHLKNRNNLDVGYKRIRYAEYIASLYAMKIVKGIYRVADHGKTACVNTIKRCLNTRPTELLDSITKCNLVNYRNLVNDLDSMAALKFTYKGISGMGDNIKPVYRYIHPSQLGRIDIDTSPKSDPGMSGMLAPMADIHGNGYFSDYQEPNYWKSEYNELLNEYKNLVGMKDVIIMQKELLGEYSEEDRMQEQVLDENIGMFANIINPIRYSQVEVFYTVGG